jgi:hypothetical protein
MERFKVLRLAERRHDRGAPAARMIAQDPNVSKRSADRRRWREMITQSEFDEMIRTTETGEQWAEICRIEAEGLVEKEIGPWVLHEGRTWICLDQLPWIDPAVVWCWPMKTRRAVIRGNWSRTEVQIKGAIRVGPEGGLLATWLIAAPGAVIATTLLRLAFELRGRSATGLLTFVFYIERRDCKTWLAAFGVNDRPRETILGESRLFSLTS